MLKTFRFKSSVLFGAHTLLDHGTIIREGITCKKILLQKSIEFGIPLK